MEKGQIEFSVSFLELGGNSNVQLNMSQNKLKLCIYFLQLFKEIIP